MRAVLMLAVALVACRFDAGERATHFRCERTGDCPADLVCSGGWCEEEATPLPDATPPDAAWFGCPCSLWDDTAVHIAHLWTGGGGLLAEAQFRDETASGWQAATFDQPVAVQPDTTYIASVYIESGYYAADVEYFLTAYVRPPLGALADGSDGGNGVFSLGSGFPDVTFMSANYWVDVVFDDG